MAHAITKKVCFLFTYNVMNIFPCHSTFFYSIHFNACLEPQHLDISSFI